MACFRSNFQAKPLILDPIRAIFDDLNPNRHFGQDLDLQDQGRETLARPILFFLSPEMPILDLTPSPAKRSLASFCVAAGDPSAKQKKQTCVRLAEQRYGLG